MAERSRVIEPRSGRGRFSIAGGRLPVGLAVAWLLVVADAQATPPNRAGRRIDRRIQQEETECMTTMWPNQGAAANGLSAVRSSVAGIRERTVRSTAAAEAGSLRLEPSL